MGNSKLVSYTKLSPNKTVGRTSRIDTITIHSMSSDMSIESCGAWFAKPTTRASSNYGIGSDGRIALYVDEKDTSWCSSSTANDSRAITIEVANIKGAPDYPISNKAYNALIDLLVDISRRNGISSLKWKNDKSLIGQVSKQNITIHKWFKNKECPGNYILDLLPKICDDVNKRLKSTIYRVQIGAFSMRENAEALLKQAQKTYKDAYIKEDLL